MAAFDNALYACNPKKNVTCDKTNCYKNGGKCRLTHDFRYAKVTNGVVKTVIPLDKEDMDILEDKKHDGSPKV